MKPIDPGRRARGRRWTGAGLVVAALFLALATEAAPVAGQEGGEPELLVLTGWDSQYRPGRAVPVLVTAPAGTDRVTVEVVGSRTKVTAPVEADGSPVRVALPTSWSDTGVRVRATAWAGDRRVARADSTAAWAPDRELVGVLGGLVDDAPVGTTVPLVAGLGSARLVAVDRATLQLPGALDALGTLASGPADLDALGDGELRSVLSWVGRGGRLLVDATEAPTALPPAWRPTVAEPVVAGLGRIRLTEGRLAAGAWVLEVEPTSEVLPAEQVVVAHPLAFAGAEDRSLAVQADVTLPALGGLLAAVGAYGLVVAAVAFLVGRKRGGRVWVAVPLVAAVALAGGAVAVAAGRAGDRQLAGVAVTELGAVDQVHADIGWSVNEPGTRRLTLPDGWNGGSPANERSGEPGTPATLRTGGTGGTTMAVHLVSGQVGVVEAWGPAPATARLTLTSEAEDRRVVGEVRNQGKVALHEVAVFVGDRAVAVGTLEGGEARPFTVDLATPPPRPASSPPEVEAWPKAVRQAITAGGRADGRAPDRDPDQQVDLARWAALLDNAGPDLRAPGAVVAAGWTTELGPPLDLGDTTRTSTLVTTRQPVGGTGSWSMPREMLRGPDQVEAEEGRQAAVFRFAVPADHSLGLLVPPAVTEVEAWDGTAFTTVFTGRGSTDADAPVGLVALPASARDGRGGVLVRVTVRADVPPGALAGLAVSP